MELERKSEAQKALSRAIELTENQAEKDYLQSKLNGL